MFSCRMCSKGHNLRLTIQHSKTHSDNPTNWKLTITPTPALNFITQTSATPRPQTPTPPSQFIIRVAELSRVKAQERQWGPVLDPIQCSRRTGLGPESSDYIPHNERPGSAGSAALSLALSHTHTDRPTAALLLKSWSVLFFSLVTALTFASAAALHIAVWPREPRGLDASLLCVCVLDGEQGWALFPRVNSLLSVWANCKLCLLFSFYSCILLDVWRKTSLTISKAKAPPTPPKKDQTRKYGKHTSQVLHLELRQHICLPRMYSTYWDHHSQ